MNIEFIENPLKKCLEKYSLIETPGRPNEESVDTWKDDALLKEYFKMNEQQRCSMSCDETFAVYLWDVSQKVNEQFYADVVLFILCYWECLNKEGWDKLEKYEWENFTDEDESAWKARE